MESNDHRKIGVEQDLFSLHEEAGSGLVFWHPRLGVVRKEIEDYWWSIHRKNGYQPIYTPHIVREELFQISGHIEKFSEMMFKPMEIDELSYRVKPMNCPGHILVYKNRNRSYREFPLRWAELGTVYRYENSGAVQGMMRARGFTQDDAHIFCRPEQLADEIAGVLNLIHQVLTTFGFSYKAYLATRPKGMSIGSDEIWAKSIESLKEAANKVNIELGLDEGGGAFYGPKIDFKITDSLGREWQLSTVQCDFNLPGADRFNLKYMDSDGVNKHPILVHRAIFGSFERFVGILIEHYNGKFPFWLAPEQVALIPVHKEAESCLRNFENELLERSFRTIGMYDNEDLRSKIAKVHERNIPLMVLAGKREVEKGQVTLNDARASGKMQNTFDAVKALNILENYRSSKLLNPSLL